MKKISANENGVIYRKRPVLALVLLAGLLLALGLAFALELSLPARLALSVLCIAAAIVGLSSEELQLDFGSRRMRYETRFAGRATKRIDDDFNRVQAVSVIGTSGERDPFRPSTPSSTPFGWNVVINYGGPQRIGILVGTFTSEEDASREARFLADHMKVSLQTLGGSR